MKKLYFLIQNTLIKNFPFPKNLNWNHCIFNNITELCETTGILDYIIKNNMYPVMFCSINNANFLLKNNHLLSTGVFLPQYPYQSGILDWNHYSTIIPQKFLLNSDGLIFPFSKLKQNRKFIFDNIGRKIFIRPISPWKPFTGFDTVVEDFDYDLNSYQKLSNVNPYELCLVAPYKEINTLEYRFWMVEGNIATVAPYNMTLQQTVDYQPPPDDMIKMVKEISEILTIYDHCFVIDMCISNGEPKMVELNGFSTSGWYNGMNIDNLFNTITTQFVN